MSGERFEYKGYEVIRNYMGHWAIFKMGDTYSKDTSPSEADAKRKIDKWLKKEDW